MGGHFQKLFIIADKNVKVNNFVGFKTDKIVEINTFVGLRTDKIT